MLLKANPDKVHLILSNSGSSMSINVDKYQSFNNNHEKWLGITIDNKMSFNDHVSNLCDEDCPKLHALWRASKEINI